MHTKLVCVSIIAQSKYNHRALAIPYSLKKNLKVFVTYLANL